MAQMDEIFDIYLSAVFFQQLLARLGLVASKYKVGNNHHLSLKRFVCYVYLAFWLASVFTSLVSGKVKVTYLT